MSRSTTVLGLNAKAREFIYGGQRVVSNNNTETILPDGTKEITTVTVTRVSYEREQYDTFEGMFGEEYPLYEYKFVDGRVYAEFEQAEVWSSGPVIFLELRMLGSDGIWREVNGFSWTEEEIESYT